MIGTASIIIRDPAWYRFISPRREVIRTEFGAGALEAVSAQSRVDRSPGNRRCGDPRHLSWSIVSRSPCVDVTSTEELPGSLNLWIPIDRRSCWAGSAAEAGARSVVTGDPELLRNAQWGTGWWLTGITRHTQYGRSQRHPYCSLFSRDWVRHVGNGVSIRRVDCPPEPAADGGAAPGEVMPDWIRPSGSTLAGPLTVNSTGLLGVGCIRSSRPDRDCVGRSERSCRGRRSETATRRHLRRGWLVSDRWRRSRASQRRP